MIRDRNGSTLLHYAAGNGCLEVCRFLLLTARKKTNENNNNNNNNAIDDDYSVDMTSEKNGRTALHWAARNGRSDVCRSLVLEFGATVDFEGKGQVTPLQLAVWQCRVDTARVLVEELGADPFFVNSWGCTVAHWLGKCPEYNDNIVNEQQQKDDIERRLEECCDWLFRRCRVPHNSPNHYGQTPLHKAAFAGNLPVVEYLVARLGAVDDVRDHLGNNAADCAERAHQQPTAVWLRRHASPLLRGALNDLGFAATTTVPRLTEIRSRFLERAKSCHPDNTRRRRRTQQQQQQKQEEEEQWNAARDAYRLLTDWWQAPDKYDIQIRIRTRNKALREYKAILWHSAWHQEEQEQRQQQQQKQNTNATKEQPQNPTTTKTKKKTNIEEEQRRQLREFETRLVRLLETDSFRSEGLPVSRLPKEYEKNWHTAVPNPKDFGCRKLVRLIQAHCPHVKVEYSTQQPSPHAWLKAA